MHFMNQWIFFLKIHVYCPLQLIIGCGDLTIADSSKCDSEEPCFCQGEHCLAGENCYTGDVFVNGKPVADNDWTNEDGYVTCKQMGFWKQKQITSNSQ